jgi:hypothetical protein
MSYLHKRITKRRRAGMSGLGDLTSLINSIGGAVGTSVDIASDPYLPEVLCHIGQLKQINAGNDPGACANAVDGMQGGVGLARAVKPMRAYVWFEQHKWAYAVAAAAIIGVPMLIGYDIGKGKR